MIYVFAAIGVSTSLFFTWFSVSWFFHKPEQQESKYSLYEYHGIGNGWGIKRENHSRAYWEGPFNWSYTKGVARHYDTPEEALESFSLVEGKRLEMKSILVTAQETSPACKLKLKFYHWLQKEC